MHLVEQKYAIASNTAEYMDAFIVLVNVILKMERSKKKLLLPMFILLFLI
jgi:hypothetical protein